VYENLQQLRHASDDIEQWGAPWDRLVFDYAIRVFHVYFTMALAALPIAIVRAGRQNARLWLVIAWALATFIPYALVNTKTPTATLLGWPAVWMLIGWLVSQSLRGDWLSGHRLPPCMKMWRLPNETGWRYSKRRLALVLHCS
jgi:hypothetical protein